MRGCGVKLLLMIVVAVSLVLASSIAYINLRSRVVLFERTADGTEIAIYQMAVPTDFFCFNTFFVYRRAGEDWRNFYYDHEDDHAWTDCHAAIDNRNKSIVVYRNSQPDIRFNWQTDVFERYGGGHFTVDPETSDTFDKYGRDIRRSVLGAINEISEN